MILLFSAGEGLSSPPPDMVVFRNGDRITGHFRAANKESVTFLGLVTGSLSLKWSDIRELNIASGHVSVVSGNQSEAMPMQAEAIEVVGADLHLKSAAEGDPSIPLSDLVSMAAAEVQAPGAPAAPPSPKKYIASGTLKISPDSIVRATQKQLSFAGAFDVGLTTTDSSPFRHQDTILAMEGNYTDSRKPGGAAIITELYSGTFQQNFYLKRVNPDSTYSKNGPYLYGIANYYHNLSLGLNIAQEYGGGIGWGGSHGGNTYRLAADLRYLNEDLYSPAKSLSGPEAGITEQYSYIFKKTGITIGQRVTWLPVLNHSNAFRIRGTAILDVPFNTSFSFGVNYLDDYLENAPPKNLPNFGKITFDVKYSFKTK